MFVTNVIFRLYRFFWLLGTERIYIYLSFDDGPLNGTQECFNLCKFHDIKANFFMVGAHLVNQSRKKLVEEIRSCEKKYFIGNHSYSHANEMYTQFYKDPILAKLDFEKAEKLFEFKNKTIRLPGFNAWVHDKSIKAQHIVKYLCNLLADDGYIVIGWDIEWNFKNIIQYERSYIVRLFKNQLLDSVCRNRTFRKNHIVVLMHDIDFSNSRNIAILEELISFFKEKQKYVFETVNNYPILKAK